MEKKKNLITQEVEEPEHVVEEVKMVNVETIDISNIIKTRNVD